MERPVEARAGRADRRCRTAGSPGSAGRTAAVRAAPVRGRPARLRETSDAAGGRSCRGSSRLMPKRSARPAPAMAPRPLVARSMVGRDAAGGRSVELPARGSEAARCAGQRGELLSRRAGAGVSASSAKKPRGR